MTDKDKLIKFLNTLTADLPKEWKDMMRDLMKRAQTPEWQEAHRRMGFATTPADLLIMGIGEAEKEADE